MNDHAVQRIPVPGGTNVSERVNHPDAHARPPRRHRPHQDPATPRHTDPLPHLTPRIATQGKFLTLDGQRFYAKAVTYGTFAPNDAGEPYPPFDRLREDFRQMADAGINTVRLYSPPSDRIANAAADAGLFLIPDICWGPRFCELHDPADLNPIYDWTRTHARRLAGHPAILMYSIGNEIPPLIVRWYGREKIERFLHDLHDIVKSASPHALTTYACHPPTEHLHLPFLNVVSFNVYLEREADFRNYLARLQNLAGERPLFLSELGLDSSAHGQSRQADVLDWQLRASFESGLCGTAVYSWTDEWSIFAEKIDGWSFGLTDADRNPKQALQTAARIYSSSLCQLRPQPWPRVSVVVCSYNGGRTLDQCLASLAQLDYPDYEVIVVDDGSTDDTPAIAARYPVRLVRVPNGGLSAARNLGIDNATGQIVAFIDADAYADPNWLFYLVSAMEHHDAAAAGGPNLCPPEDGFVAECVDHAPGNPTHVLRADHLAEHVPGCNMAFRTDALRAVDCFDAIHRAAGDDVDVCWKLLARDKKIVFSPGAMVWHHRRPSVRAFLKQQKGYGYAESHLRLRYPGRFNVFGYAVWPGSIYDAPSAALRQQGLPSLLEPRVYQGLFGSAQFQSLYQRFHNWWFQIFTTVEWQALALCALCSAAIALAIHARLQAVILAALFLATLAPAIGAALAAGRHAARARHWAGPRRRRGTLLVAFLHLAQPWARLAGRFKGWRHTRTARPQPFPSEQKVWGNLTQRENWLLRLDEHLRHCGWNCRLGSDWSSDDLIIDGPGPCRITLASVAEERLEKGFFFVRWRIRHHRKWSGTLAAICVAALALVCALHWYTIPLAIPLAGLLGVLARAPRAMTQAVSQLAHEIAEGQRMPIVEGGF